ncbi:hypothetical protein [Microbacterium timonense]
MRATRDPGIRPNGPAWEGSAADPDAATRHPSLIWAAAGTVIP